MSVLNRKTWTTIALIAALLLAASPPVGAATFTTHTITDTANGASSVYAVDLDGDSDVDVLSSSNIDDKVAWYENDGSENFTPHTITTAADGARSVKAVDVDGDLDIDVLSASFNDNKIAWYENDGSENFTQHTITTAALGARSVFAMDVDGDLDIDVLSASFNDHKVAWYENDGAENFTAHTISTIDSGAYLVYAVDVDGDSDIDVLSASFTENKINWYENDGSENFTAHTITSGAVGATSVFAVDVDGDSDVDVLSSSFGDNKIAWYENDGSENFTAHTITSSATGATSVFAEDLDGDSDMDVLSASSVDYKVAWYENDGSEVFTSHVVTTAAGGVQAVHAADVNGDSQPDLLSASFSDGRIAWYENIDATPITTTLHPTGDGGTVEFTTTGCTGAWDCVNDQTGNAGTGSPEAYDPANYLDGANGQRVMLSMDDEIVPAGATITQVVIVAQVYRGNGSGANVRLSYQRMPGASTPDTVPIDGPGFDLTTGCCTEVSTIWSTDGWTTDDLDNLEIGLLHNSGNSSSHITQMYVNISYVSTTTTIISNGGGDSASVSVGENADTVTTVTAVDPDPDTLTYTIIAGADSVLFTISPDSGVLTFTTAPDYESPTDANVDNVYEVTVQADDGNGNADSQAISVTVTNVPLTAVSASGADSVAVGATYTLNLNADEDASSWIINWGDGEIEPIVGDPASVTHAYNQAGFTFNILVAAVDVNDTAHASELNVAGQSGTDDVYRYDADGAYLNRLGVDLDGIQIPSVPEFGPDGNLYISGYSTNNVLRYNPATGALIDTFVTTGDGGLSSATGLAFGPNGNLYVGSEITNEVLRYNGATGVYVDEFVPPGSGGLDEPKGIKFGPDGHLYVISSNTNAVLRYHGFTGVFIDTFVTPGSGGLDWPQTLDFGSDSNLFIASYTSNSVHRYDGSNGTFIDTFVTPGSGGLSGPTGLKFGPDGQLYVAGFVSDDVQRYDATTGTSLGAYVTSGLGGLDGPNALVFRPAHQVTVTPLDSDGDGLWDAQEDANTDADNDPSTTPGPDTDGDLTVNYLDADDDDDGTATASENADPNSDGDPRDAVDSDRDGQPDYLDLPTLASDGTVGSEQKISDTIGGLSATLIDDDRFGTSVAAIGDLDGDGINDIAVGAQYDNDGGSNNGAVHVLFLNADGTVKSEQKISDTTGGLTATLDDGDLFGIAVAGIGDLDGDGIRDIAAGALQDDDGGPNRGAVHILFLNADGTVRSEQKISDTTGGLTATLGDGDGFGMDVAGIGDLDGDGIGDIAVGTYFDDDGGSNRGAVYILFLNASGTVKAEQKISDTAGSFSAILDDDDIFGVAVAGIGDLDSDGINDIAVGAELDDDGGPDRGAVYVLLLNADGTVKAEQKISDTAGGFTAVLDDSVYFGVSIAGIGDLDDDGINDVAVGAMFDNDGGSDRGAVHVLFLNSDGSVKAEQKISDTAGGLTGSLDDGDRFGIGVAGIGDLDGDSLIDIAVGAHTDDDGGDNRGAVYVLHLAAPQDTISVSVSDPSFTYGVNTLDTWLTPQTSVVTNDGTVAEDFVAQVSQFNDGTNNWDISNSANGADSIRAQWSTTSDTGPWTDIAAYASDFTIATNVAASDSITVWFRIQTPVATSSYSEHSSTLTVTAEAN